MLWWLAFARPRPAKSPQKSSSAYRIDRDFLLSLNPRRNEKRVGTTQSNVARVDVVEVVNRPTSLPADRLLLQPLAFLAYVVDRPRSTQQ